MHVPLMRRIYVWEIYTCLRDKYVRLWGRHVPLRNLGRQTNRHTIHNTVHEIILGTGSAIA